MIWGIAGSYEFKERLEFQELIKGLVSERTALPKTIEGETIFDYYLVNKENGFEWKTIQPTNWKAPKIFFFSRLLIPTIDSTRADLLTDMLLGSGSSVLLLGGAGTAKTSSILMYANKFDNDKMLFHKINFSSATQPVHFQLSIESVCESKVRKGFGPKDGK